MMNYKVNFSLSLDVKKELKPKRKKRHNHQNTVPPWGDEEWKLVAPLILLMQITRLFIGVTCDHSLGGSQVFTMFYKCLLKKGVLLGVPDAPNPPNFGRVSSYLFANLHKTASKQ
jgi:hypothetical protein